MTDDTMIERLARAVYEEMPYDGPGHTTKPAWVRRGNSLKQDEARRYVRAVLHELREPTEGMIAAGMKHEGTDLASEYTAMLDHILSQ